MTVLNPPGWLENAGATHTSQQMRMHLSSLAVGRYSSSSLTARGGVNPIIGSRLSVSAQGTPDMSVVVGSGVAVISGTEVSSQGAYFFINDANVTLSVTAAHATLPRIDIVVARVYDSDFSGASNTSALEVIAGTPASSPVAPTTPNNSLVLAELAVSAADTSIVAGDITDRRFYMGTAGGAINFQTEALMNAVTFNTLPEGTLAWAESQNSLHVSDGSAWKQLYPERKMLARGRRTTNSSQSSGTTAVGVLRLDDIPILAGRAYAITTSILRIRATVGNDRGRIFITYTTDGSTPTTASTVLPTSEVEMPIQSAGNNNGHMINSYYFPASNETLSLLLCTARVSGTGNFYIEASAAHPADIVVMDAGVDPGDTGTDI